MVEGEVGGNYDTNASKKRLIISGAAASLVVSNSYREDFQIKLDPRVDPRTIDLRVISGSGLGKEALGIYRLSEDGNKMEICYANFDVKKRPKKFRTKPGVGNGFVYLVLKREKP